MNDHDLFGLNEPVKRFSERLSEEGIDADIQIMPATGHDVWTEALRKEVHEDMDSVLTDRKLSGGYKLQVYKKRKALLR